MLQTLRQATLFVVVRSIIAAVIIGLLFGAVLLHGKLDDAPDVPFSDKSCNVAVIPVNGFISTLSEDINESYSVNADDVVYQLRAADSQEHVKAILVQIDSGGGMPVASEMLTSELLRTSKPTVALIREGGTSGAYMLATGTDTIIASSMSDVGSIGVTASYVETAGSMAQEGNRYIELTAGKYKDSGDPNKELTEEEKALLQRDLDVVHEKFITMVATNRNIPIEDVRALSDGSSMTGEMGLEKKLVDMLGDQETARAHIAKIIREDVKFCEVE